MNHSEMFSRNLGLISKEEQDNRQHNCDEVVFDTLFFIAAIPSQLAKNKEYGIVPSYSGIDLFTGVAAFA